MDDLAVLGAITSELRRQQMVKIFHVADGAGFKDNPFMTFKGNWHSLIAFDDGLFHIERTGDARHLHWRLAADIGFRVVVGMAGVLFVLLIVLTGDAGASARTAGLAFAWLYGGNLLNVAFRVPRLIRTFVTKPDPMAEQDPAS
ncbi:MAG: hypothetical protein JNL35_12470 [Sphingopyxis sp.]|nr:hypothetical protein [Sphingopyxis sp.]